MTRNHKGQFTKTMSFSKKLIILAIFLIGTLTLLHFTGAQQEQPKQQVRPDPKLEAIRNREDIKKQQELLVQEAYLLDQKQEAEQAKKAANEKYQSQINQIETQLEQVRSQKLSFQ